MTRYLILAFLSFASCGPQPWTGSGMARTFTRDVGPFTGVDINHGFNVQIQENRQRAYPEVRLTIDDNLANFVQLQAPNGLLSVQLMQAVQAQQKSLMITMPAINRLLFAGRSQGSLDNITGQSQVQIDLSGDSQLTIAKLESDVLRVKLSTNSRLTINSGTASTLILEGSARSNFIGENLVTQRIDAVLNTGATARVQSMRQLNVQLSDNSSLSYKGNPQIQPQILSRDAKLSQIN